MKLCFLVHNFSSIDITIFPMLSFFGKLHIYFSDSYVFSIDNFSWFMCSS